MKKTRTYRVKSPLSHDRKYYEIGSTIELHPREAAAIPPHVLELHRKEEEAEK